MITAGSIGRTNANTLANYVLKHFGPMSHLKLQKLLYYCDAYHLAYFEEPLINENFEAWVHGPVCREVYNSLKDTSILHMDLRFDSQSDINPDLEINEKLNTSQKDILSAILKNFRDWTGIELENATHNDLPWIEARKGLPPSKACSNIISKTSMKNFYFDELYGSK